MFLIRAHQEKRSRWIQPFFSALLSTALLFAPWIGGLGSCSQVRPMPVRWRACEQSLSRPPARRGIMPLATKLRRTLLEPMDAWFSLPGSSALDVNELDMVVDSSWYRNPRDGPAAFYGHRGAAPSMSAFAAMPSLVGSWRVSAAGLFHGRPWIAIRDARGRAFVLSFDAPGMAGLATGSEYLVTRILGELGYLVPLRSVVLFRSSRLSWPWKVPWCPEWIPVTPTHLSQSSGGWSGCLPGGRNRARAAMAKISRTADGTIRALSTKLEIGRDLGPFPLSGNRKDDPNDRIPHERRRSIRALRLIGAWLDLRGLGEAAGRDLFFRGRLHHFLWFPGGGLGVSESGLPRKERVAPVQAGSWPSWPTPTGSWHPLVRHPGLSAARGPDIFWAARIVASLSPGRIRTLVSEAYLQDKLAGSLMDRLTAAREAALKVGLSAACSAGEFRVENFEHGKSRLCFRDLFPGASRRRRFVVRWAGRRRTMRPGQGLACLPLLRSHGRWLLVRIQDAGRRRMQVVLERRNGWRIAAIRRF